MPEPPYSEFTPRSSGARVGLWLRVLLAVAGGLVITWALLWISKEMIADPLIKRGLKVFALKEAPAGALDTLRARTPECETMESLVKKTIREFRECRVDADCASISLGCPFGCATAIRATAYVDIGSLNAAFQSRCSYCLDGCAAEPAPAVCRRGLCTLDFRPTPPPGG